MREISWQKSLRSWRSRSASCRSVEDHVEAASEDTADVPAAMGNTAPVRLAPRNAHKGNEGGAHRVTRTGRAERGSRAQPAWGFQPEQLRGTATEPGTERCPRPATAPARRAAVLARCGSRRQLRVCLTGLGGKSQNLPYSVFGACLLAFSDKYRYFSPHSRSAVKKNRARGKNSSRCLTLKEGKQTPGCDPRRAGR